MVFAIVGPRRSVFERFTPDKRPDVRDGVGRVGNEFVGNGADRLVPFVAVAKSREASTVATKARRTARTIRPRIFWLVFIGEVCSLSEHDEIDKIESWAERQTQRRLKFD